MISARMVKDFFFKIAYIIHVGIIVPSENLITSAYFSIEKFSPIIADAINFFKKCL